MKIEGYDYGTREIVDTKIEPRLAWTKDASTCLDCNGSGVKT